MAKKFYAVRKGRKTGIFPNWSLCEEQVKGFSGAEYKSFTTQDEAESYLNIVKKESKSETDFPIHDNFKSQAIAYVDGSYNKEAQEFSYGCVIFWNGYEYHLGDKSSDPKLVVMNNVAGELKGAERAIEFALENSIGKLTIYHDYEGIAKWCTGEWEANKEGTKAYVDFYNTIKERIKIEFIKVKGHSGDRYNDLADQLANQAMNNPINKKIKSSTLDTVIQDKTLQIEKVKSRKVYLDKEKIADYVVEAGKNEWDDFRLESLTKNDSVIRCKFFVGEKKAILDFYIRDIGPITLTPTGINLCLSQKLSYLIEDKFAYKEVGNAINHSLSISKHWAMKLVDFMQKLDRVTVKKDSYSQPKHERYQFTSPIGDQIIFNIYDSGKLLIQGKQAYLYCEAMSLLSYCPELTFNDIIETNNKFQNIQVNTDDIRNELKSLIPTAYDGIDGTILKILSPSIVLKKITMELEDYSCYTFPALRALEGYLKYLLSTENIEVGNSFGPLFDCNPQNGQYYLKNSHAENLSNIKIKSAVEKVYNYFHANRHTIFHTDQILFMSKILDDRREAELIINEVLNMIEATYIDIIN